MININPMEFNIFKRSIFSNKEEIKIPSGLTYLIGENGSGKTIFIKSIMNVLGDNSKSIKFNGKSYFEEIKNIKIVFDEEYFIERLNGFENLIYFNNYSDNKIEVAKIKKYYDIWNSDSKAKYSEYSLGMKKRLAITFALMYETDFLLMDEPFNALDSSAQNLLIDTLVYKRSEDKTIIVTSHEMEKMLLYCDHLLVIHENELHFFGNIGEKRNDFVNCQIIVRKSKEIKEIEKYILELKELSEGMVIKVQVEQKDYILSKLRELGVEVIRHREEAMSIKEILETLKAA